MFTNVFRAQQTKALRSEVLWVELLVLAAITGLLVVLTNSLAELRVEAPAAMAGQVGDMLEHLGISTMGHVLVVILAGALMANDYGWRSLHLWLGQGVPRTTFLWAKFASILVPVVLFFLLTAAVTAPIAGGFAQSEHGTVGPVLGELGGLFETAALGAYSVLPFAALALLLAVAGRSMLVAVGGGLAVTILTETMAVQVLALIGGRAADAIAYLPGSLATGLLGSEVQGGLYTPLDPWPAGALVAAYTLAFLAAATVVFRRQDLNG